MSQNVVLYLQNIKKMAKKPLAVSKILLYFANRLVIICHKIELQINAMCAYFNKI